MLFRKFVNKYIKEIRLEIKDNNIYHLAVDKLNKQIVKGLNPENIIVSSFFYNNIFKIKELVKEIKTGCLASGVSIRLSEIAADFSN